MFDPAQAIHLEQALTAIDNDDRAAALGALTTLEITTLDHLHQVITHPVWDTLGRRPLAIPTPETEGRRAR